MTNRIFEVGGSIRDGLLGKPTKDRDFAVETDSYVSMRNIILNLGGKIFLETPEHFTIRANVPQFGSADYVLCRKDGTYSDGRHPDSVTVGTILDDLARRDFTINAMARDMVTGELIDPFNGRRDLDNRIIACVGLPEQRFDEDALRIFRAVRFSITKKLDIDKETENWVRRLGSQYNPKMESVSTERIREEVLKMFQADTQEAIYVLFTVYKGLGALILNRGIWFEPTTKGRP